ncbi:hypothetical protein OOZ63_28485 [Paucibacter sp. PLA-PC-4]|uniref:hypothetical protein n=1 Tax=Paucibacter sp. PLA-PC-4 TaxID=2993655 RepID=UPI00224AB7CC|nr:hypothetical protein [Paucibacter sp. PLA-PC-4]MCX2865765.1 hypothetical protein [Paucibacter sp. PLA-PC-4]
MLLKNALTFCHLLAMAVAVGKMLDFDFRFLRSVHMRPSPQLLQDLGGTKTTMTLALIALWFSGAALVYLGYAQNPEYLMNEKLWAKISTVIVLSVNGLLMHRFAFPILKQGGIFLDLPQARMLALTLFAAISSVSWLYASFLGIARSWNNTAPISYTMGIYATLVLGAGAAAMLGMSLLRQQHVKRAALPSFADTEINKAGCPN